MNPYQHAASLLPGLPATRLPAAARRSGATRSARLGATQTNLARPAAVVPVAGQPSLKLEHRGAGAASVLLRRIPNADLLSDADLAPLRALLGRAQVKAEGLSQGRMSTREQARRGNPFGRGSTTPGGRRRGAVGRARGARGGVSNLSVVNRQSGELARSWASEIVRAKDGLKLELSNDTKQAGFTAFGTRKMVAHGPATAAVVLQLPAINLEVQRLARLAKAKAAQVEVRVS